MDALERRKRYVKRLDALRNERSSWEPHWRDLNDYLQPRRGRFNITDSNQGRKLNSHIINSTPLIAVRTLAAGMMAGLTSPARPWFMLAVPDAKLNEAYRVKEWLRVVQDRIRQLFERSNVYQVLQSIYVDLVTFGTAVGIFDADIEDGIRGHVIPVGSYCLATSYRQKVDTLYREFQRTVGQLVEDFGLPACSKNIQEQFKRGNVDQWVEVCHVIEPNRDYSEGKLGVRGKRWLSTWFEKSKRADGKFLRQKGYDSNPLVAVRWDVTGEDVYGRSPGMDALGDAKALQLLEKRKITLVDKMADPPMRAPTSLRASRTSLLPGDITYVDSVGDGATFEPAQVVDVRGVQAVGEEIARHENRVNEALYATLWLMMQQTDKRMTATEVAERQSEKLTQLGPVTERLRDEMLDPLIDRAFAILSESGQLPPPPPELDGQSLRVEYLGMLAQAQKAIGVMGVERLLSTVLTLGQGGKPEALDKLDEDKVVDAIGDMLGVRPDLLRPADEVARVRAVRAQQAQQQAAAERAATLSQATRNLAGAPTDGDNALTGILASMGAPTGGLQ